MAVGTKKQEWYPARASKKWW